MENKFADVNGVRLHYLIAGKGDPIVLLHGFAETSHMWLPLISKALRQTHSYRAGFARLRPVVHAFGWIHQSGDGAGHPCADEEPQIRPHPTGRPRYRSDG